jgi:hypothetical protein
MQRLQVRENANHYQQRYDDTQRRNRVSCFQPGSHCLLHERHRCSALRCAALASNVASLIYGIGLGLQPAWLLHAALLPINALHLCQAVRCDRRARRGRNEQPILAHRRPEEVAPVITFKWPELVQKVCICDLSNSVALADIIFSTASVMRPTTRLGDQIWPTRTSKKTTSLWTVTATS